MEEILYLFDVKPDWTFANVQFKDTSYCTLFKTNSGWQWFNIAHKKETLVDDCQITIGLSTDRSTDLANIKE